MKKTKQNKDIKRKGYIDMKSYNELWELFDKVINWDYATSKRK